MRTNWTRRTSTERGDSCLLLPKMASVWVSPGSYFSLSVFDGTATVGGTAVSLSIRDRLTLRNLLILFLMALKTVIAFWVIPTWQADHLFCFCTHIQLFGFRFSGFVLPWMVPNCPLIEFMFQCRCTGGVCARIHAIREEARLAVRLYSTIWKVGEWTVRKLIENRPLPFMQL